MQPLLLVVAILAGCGSNDIVVRGRVERARTRPDTFWPLVGGTVSIVDGSGVVYNTATTDVNGKFSTLAPAGQTVYAEVTGDGLAVSSFTGITGDSHSGALVIAVDSKQDSPLFGVLLPDVDKLRANFAGCPGADRAGGIAFGEVRVSGIVDPVTDEEPTVGTASVHVIDDSGNDTSACYLSDDGQTYNPDATVTGPTGRFAAFGLAPGHATLSVSYMAVPNQPITAYSDSWVPDADLAVIPRLPAWVEFPF